MSEQLARTLRRLEIDRMVEKLRLGSQEMPPCVFCMEAGTPLDESRVRRAFALALKRTKLPGFHLYDLRHNAGSRIMPSWSSASKFSPPERLERQLIYPA
jgi:integrase